MENFGKLEKKFGLDFKNKDLLKQAFVHRSYINENPKLGLWHNERLEFLGDAVIELIVTEHLFSKHPEKDEGEMTNWRAALVNARTLSGLADKIGLNEFLLLSKGEKKEMGKARSYILANTFEALIGAIYIDGGYEEAEKFIKKHLIPALPEIIEKGLNKDAKSKFQEKAQEKVSITPSYKVLKESGPDHEKNFVIGVYLKDELIGEGKGSSKQEAEESAAKSALKNKHWNNK